MTPPGSDEAVPFKVGTDGRNFFSIDDNERILYRGRVMNRAQPLAHPSVGLFMREFVHPTPFSDELNADSAEHQGVQEIGDVKCDVIYVVYSRNQGQARWFFGQEDHLPRRVDRIMRDGRQEGATVLVISRLQADPSLPRSLFRPKTPEGYAEKEYVPVIKPGRKAALAVGKPAPDWQLQTPDGRTVSLKELRGQVVVLDFWAIWCAPCKAAMPSVQKLHETFKDKPVKVIGSSCAERGGDPAAYMRQKKYTYGLLVKGDKVADRYHVTDLPTFVVVDPDGKVAYVSSGVEPGTEKKLIEAVRKQLKESQL
jgi:thiol-disulfide isomerase/thioredoxin